MKTISVSVGDDLYAAATAEAAKRHKTLSDLLRDLLAGLQSHRETANDAEQRAELEQLFAIVEAKPKLPGSVGPLNREELYQHEQWAEQDDRAALVARLELLFVEADARDRDKKGSAGPFSREELYAQHLN